MVTQGVQPSDAGPAAPILRPDSSDPDPPGPGR